MSKPILYPQHAVIDELFEQFFSQAFDTKRTNSKYPLTDIYEEDGNIVIEMAVAGFSKDEIKVKLEKDTLKISGSKNKDEFENRKYFKRDIAYRDFEKAYNLLFPIKTVDASFNNGILKIIIEPETSIEETKEIEIK